MQMGYGSYNQFSLAADGAGKRGNFDLAGRAAFTSIGGWRPHSDQQRESWLAASRTVLDNGWDLTIQLMAARPQYEVPGPLTLTTALNDPTATVPAVVRDDPRRETEYAQVAASASRNWGGTLAEVGLGGIYHDDLFYQLQANGVSDTEAMEGYLSLRIEEDWRAGQVWNLAKHHTEFSALLQAGQWDAQRYRNDGGHLGRLIGDHAMSPLTLTAALYHQFLLTENQQVELGISTLTAQREMDDRLSPASGGPTLDSSFAGTRLAPRVAWSWTPLEDTTFVVSYARSYEPPTYNDLLFTSGPLNARVLGSTSLDWQRADSFELAARGQLAWLEWSSAIYYSPWKGELLRLANDDGSSRGTVNANRTLHTGWENRVEAKLAEDDSSQLTAWATYNLTHARFDNDPIYGDGRLAGVSPHTGAIGLRAVFPDGWYIAPGCQWRAGDTYGDHARTLSYGGTALWSLEMGRRHPDGWSVSLGIHNLFDRRAIASTAGVLERAPAPQNAAIFLPSAGRTVELRCGFEW
jgi:iron complex outermembrane receptor protein